MQIVIKYKLWSRPKKKVILFFYHIVHPFLIIVISFTKTIYFLPYPTIDLPVR